MNIYKVLPDLKKKRLKRNEKLRMGMLKTVAADAKKASDAQASG